MSGLLGAVNFDGRPTDQAEIGERCEAIYAVETQEYPGCFREFVMAYSTPSLDK